MSWASFRRRAACVLLSDQTKAALRHSWETAGKQSTPEPDEVSWRGWLISHSEFFSSGKRKTAPWAWNTGRRELEQGTDWPGLAGLRGVGFAWVSHPDLPDGRSNCVRVSLTLCASRRAPIHGIGAGDGLARPCGPTRGWLRLFLIRTSPEGRSNCVRVSLYALRFAQGSNSRNWSG